MDYRDFRARSSLTGQEYVCRFAWLQTAISLRHSDTVDVKFLVNGHGVIVALPHRAWVEYQKRTGREITDAQGAEAAATLLKEALERGDDIELLDLNPTVEEVLKKLIPGSKAQVA